MAQPIRFEAGERYVEVHEAWTAVEVREAIERILDEHEGELPARRDARIVIKPNLNNDLVALTGNCTDLRVLGSLVEGLLNRGWRNLVLADGSNVGIHRRGISTFRRLRVDRLAARYGVETLDLNHDEAREVRLEAGAHPRVAATILDCDYLVSVPKIKTHAEAQLSCAMKNWVGIARGQDKRHIHYDLGRNIHAINEVVRPDLVIVDGLVGMEGNGPGDGEPFRFGRILAANDAFLNDLVVARLVGLPWRRVPYLVHAVEAGHLDPSLAERVARELPVIRPIRPAPPRSFLAELSEARSLRWLKLAVRPALNDPRVLEAAYRLRIVQDVYLPDDDTVTGLRRHGERCGTCRRCEDFCPTGLSVEEIGVRTAPEDCIQCLYCWWVCPRDAIELEGGIGHMERQVRRYKEAIEAL